jgi:hypothetical protein
MSRELYAFPRPGEDIDHCDLRLPQLRRDQSYLQQYQYRGPLFHLSVEVVYIHHLSGYLAIRLHVSKCVVRHRTLQRTSLGAMEHKVCSL